jgi:hypothetical protein
MENFTISELGDRPGHLHITSPGSFASANRTHCFRLTLKTPPARATHRVLSSVHQCHSITTGSFTAITAAHSRVSAFPR